MSLLKPVPPVDLERPLGGRGIQEDEAGAPAKLDREPVEETQHLGRRLRGEARDPDDPHVELADPGLKLDIDRPADYEEALRLAHLESRFNPE